MGSKAVKRTKRVKRSKVKRNKRVKRSRVKRTKRAKSKRNRRLKGGMLARTGLGRASPPQGEDAIIAEIERRGGTYDPEEKIAAFVNPRLPQNRLMEIGFLENAIFLQELSIYYQGITDISPLSGLTSLQKLELSTNEIHDLRPLAGLGNLEHLNLDDQCGDTRLSDLRPLAGLENLEILSLKGCEEIQDLGHLAGLKSLKLLDFEDTKIDDVSVLIDLKRNYGALEEVTGFGFDPDLSRVDREQIKTLHSMGIEVGGVFGIAHSDDDY